MSHTAVFQLGTTRDGDERPHLLGCLASFPHTAQGATVNSPRKTLSGQEVRTRVVKNDSGGELVPGRIAAWKSGSAGTAVGGYCAAGDVGAGIVDPRLSSNVADGELFHLIVAGPTQVIASTAVSANAELSTAASGKAVTLSSEASESRFGIANTAAADADDEIDVVVEFVL